MTLAMMIFVPFIFVAQEPSCSDGIQNRDEVGVDCGGVFCADCDRQEPGLQRVSTSNLCLFLSHDDVDVKSPSLAVSNNGEWFILGFENDNDGTYHVYTGTTDGSESQLIYQSNDPWPQVLSPIVSISDDGEKVLWSDAHYDGIFVANYDGSNSFKIAEEHTSAIGDMRTYVNYPIVFNSAGDKVIFRNDAGGQINLIHRNGIFEVGLNQVVADPIIINKDLQERYRDEIDYYSDNDILDFTQDEDGQIVFLSNIIGSRFYGDLFLYENSDFDWLEIDDVPMSFNRFDLSGDGNFLAWQEKHPDSTYAARVYKRNLTTNDHKYYYFEDWDLPTVFLNQNGELLEMHNSSGNMQTHVMINDEDQVFPSMQIYLSHGLRRLFDSVIGLVMSKHGERIVFAVNTDENRNSFEVWSVDWTPELAESDDFAQLLEARFDPGYAIYEDEREFARFEAEFDPAFPTPEWIEYMSYHNNALFEEGDIWFPLYRSTQAASGYDRLSNDGMTQGDEAVDNVFTENRLYPNYYAVPNVTDIANGSARINLYTNSEFKVTGYDYGPFTAYRKGNLVNVKDVEHSNLEIMISLDDDYIYIKDTPVGNGPYNFEIFSIDGRKLMQGRWQQGANSGIDISTLNPGQYVFVIKDQQRRNLTTMKFVRAE